jgi:hypothetical protein
MVEQWVGWKAPMLAVQMVAKRAVSMVVQMAALRVVPTAAWRVETMAVELVNLWAGQKVAWMAA